jgi:hypothetical protein
MMNPTGPTPLLPYFRRVHDAGFDRMIFGTRRRMDFTPLTVLFETDGETS